MAWDVKEMVVGVLRVRLMIHDAYSLKDKRRVLKSLKDRIGGKFNVSIAEVDPSDHHRHAVLGISLVGNDSRYVHSCLDKIVDKLRMVRHASLIDYQIELL